MRTDTVTIRDRVNPERVLGHLTRRPCALRGPHLEMAVMRRLALHAFDPCRPVDESISRIRFQVSYRTSADGYEKHAEFLTDTPLGVLMMLDTFQLPGESREQADFRRMTSSV